MSIAPWDQIRYFQQPKETTFSMTNNPILIAPADPMRVVLMMGAPVNAGGVTVSTLSNLTTAAGFLLSQNTPPIILTQEHHGPIVQLAWYGIGAALLKISVLTVSMQRWFADEVQGPLHQAALQAAINAMTNQQQTGRAQYEGAIPQSR